jgi:hypothetical protein
MSPQLSHLALSPFPHRLNKPLHDPFALALAGNDARGKQIAAIQSKVAVQKEASRRWANPRFPFTGSAKQRYTKDGGSKASCASNPATKQSYATIRCLGAKRRYADAKQRYAIKPCTIEHFRIEPRARDLR